MKRRSVFLFRLFRLLGSLPLWSVVLASGLPCLLAVAVPPSDAAYDRAMAALAHGDTEAAIPLLEETLRLEPKHADALYQLGMAQATRSRWQKAAALFQRAIEADENHIEAYVRLADVYFKAFGRSKDALPFLRHALALDPDNAGAHRLIGKVLLRERRTDEAVGHLSHALCLNPADDDALYHLGLAYVQAGKWDSAVTELERLLDHDLYHAQGTFHLGNCYLRLGKKEEGKKMLERFERLRQEEEELDLLRAEIQRHPANADAWFQAGRWHLRRQKWDDALYGFQKALEATPNEPKFHEAMAYVYAQMGEYDLALEACRTLVRQFPAKAEYRSNLGAMFLQLDKSADAIPHFLEAIRLNPAVPGFYRNLAQAYENVGMAEKAKDAHATYERLESGKQAAGERNE